MPNPSVSQLLQQIKQDKAEFTDMAHGYKEKVKSHLVSPWVLGGAFVVGIVIARSKLVHRKKAAATAVEGKNEGFLAPAIIGLLSSTALPKLAWEVYQNIAKPQQQKPSDSIPQKQN